MRRAVLEGLSTNALEHLREDPVMAKLIDGFEPFEWRASGKLYEDLLGTVVSQQLSTRAADTIWTRVKETLGGDLSAERILEVDEEVLRSAGLSSSKAGYFKGIAEAKLVGGLDEKKLSGMDDLEVAEELMKLKGIGRWSVEMILIFTLGRPDIFSLGDLGLRKVVASLYGVDRDDLERIEAISLKWSPYRSTASRYLWKWLDGD